METTQEERFKNVIIKLGLSNAGDQAIFRRLTYSQLTNNSTASNDGSSVQSSAPVKVLKKHAVQLTLQSSSALSTIRVSDYAVQLVYTDQDGDKVMIAVREDLWAALDEAVESGKLKILATVQPKQAPATACAETQTKSPVQLQAVVESIVSLLATAAVAVQNQVKNAAAEITEEVQNEAARAKRPSLTAAVPEPEPAPPAESPPEEPVLFIHGRHTCDGCLTTPIVGKRFHAVNLPDYDLCETCKNNYTGAEIQFEEAVLDRDRPFQERWSRRHAKWSNNGGPRCGPGRRGRSIRGGPRGGRPRCWAPPPPPPHFGPPPHHFGPPPHHFGSPPPPPPHGPFDPFAPPPPLNMFAPQQQPDLALAEALRRSLEAEQEDVAPVQVNLKEPVIVETDKESKASPAVSTTSFEEEAAVLESEAATALGQTFDRVAQVIDGMHSELERSHVSNMSDDMSDDNVVSEDDVSEDGVVSEVDVDDVPEDDFGPTIVDGEEEEASACGSQNSWDMVPGSTDNDEALARAAQSLGSALFHSDMGRSSASVSIESVPTTIASIPPTRWSAQLEQLHSMGFENDTLLVEILESLEAANIGVDATDQVTVQQVLAVLMKED